MQQNESAVANEKSNLGLIQRVGLKLEWYIDKSIIIHMVFSERSESSYLEAEAALEALAKTAAFLADLVIFARSGSSMSAVYCKLSASLSLNPPLEVSSESLEVSFDFLI